MCTKAAAAALSVALYLLGTSLWPGLTPAAQAKTTWDHYVFTGINHPVTVALNGFADEVKRRTGGELEIVVRPAGELPFRATEVVKVTGDNLVQIGSAYASFVAGAAPLSAIGGAPFLIRNTEDLEKAWPVIKEYADKEFARYGVKILFHWAWPPQNFFGTGATIRTIEDFSGRKLRTSDPKQSEMLRLFNASSVTLTTEEVPVALERRVIEGVASAAFNVVGAKWAELLRWAWLPDMNVGGPNYELVNAEAFNKLPAQVRAVLEEVGAEWGKKMTRQFVGQEAQDRTTLRERFKIELVQPDGSEIAKATRLMGPSWQVWAERNGPDGVAMMRRVRAAVGK